MFPFKNSELDINPNIPGLIYCSDLSNTILSASRGFSQLHAQSEQCSDSLKLKDIFSTTTCALITKNNKAAVTSKSNLRFQEAWLFNSGKIVHCECERQPVFDAQGTPIAIITTALQNIKGIEQLKREKEVTELYLHNIIENLADHVFWEDCDGKILGCNERQAKNVGFDKADQMIGKTIYEIAQSLHWEPKLVENLRQSDREVMRNKVALSVEEELIWADGIPRVYLSKKAPLKNHSGKVIGIIGLSFDITERKRTEEALRIAKEQAESANLAKSNFIANISHDLRTPLHTLLGIAELLQIKRHYPEQEELIEGIIQSGGSLLHLVEQILQFSESETNTSAANIKNIDLKQLIESLTVENSAKINKDKVNLIISYCESTPRLIKSNPQYLRRILNNLLGNAIKFTKKGHILVAVEPVEICNDYATLQIIVEDTGEGIAAKDISYIFERFYRANPSFTGKHKGSGLGLAIAKQLTEHLNGKLNVNSQLGMGTTFSCTLTFKLTSQVIDHRKIEQQLASAKILIIDDHVKRREALLKQIPCKNKLALTSTKAVDILTKETRMRKHNLFIIDDEIKAMSPEPLARIIRSNFHPKEQPLVILVSKQYSSQIVSVSHNFFQQHLSKPIQSTEISHRLVPAWLKWQESQQRKCHQPVSSQLDILLVEDEPLIQKFTKAILNEFGCDVEIAKDGHEALSKSERPFDLIFMDIGLPDVDGISVTQKIRRTKKSNHETPIIALTAHVSDEDKKRCLDAGINDFLTKPASYSTFKRLLTKYQ